MDPGPLWRNLALYLLLLGPGPDLPELAGLALIGLHRLTLDWPVAADSALAKPYLWPCRVATLGHVPGWPGRALVLAGFGWSMLAQAASARASSFLPCLIVT